MLAYLIGGLFTLAGIGTIVFKLLRGSNAEALLKNQDTKAKVIDIQTGISKDQGLLGAEQAKRDQAQKDLQKKENKDVSDKDLTDFLNDNKPS